MVMIGYVTSKDKCNHTIWLKQQQEVAYDVMELITTALSDCRLHVSTVTGWRVVLTFDYIPPLRLSKLQEDCVYASDYLLIGNDFTAIGQELLTSYKFCTESQDVEIVSREAYLWVVLKSPSGRPAKLRLHFKALAEERCEEGQTQCSPVQCVDAATVCDGHKDCSNGHDEFCYDFTNVSRLLGKDHREVALLPPAESACFLCRDGTCIFPRAPRYDWRWGVWLWYLCDGVQQCPDGWDEHKYMCYLRKHFPEKVQSHLFVCEAFDPPAGVSRQVRMWSLARCDVRRDCRQEWEESEGHCDVFLQTRSTEKKSQLHLDPLILTLVLSFTVLLLFSALFIVRNIERKRSTVCTDSGQQLVTDVDPPSCLSEKCITADDICSQHSMVEDKFQWLPETAV